MKVPLFCKKNELNKRVECLVGDALTPLTPRLVSRLRQRQTQREAKTEGLPADQIEEEEEEEEGKVG